MQNTDLTPDGLATWTVSNIKEGIALTSQLTPPPATLKKVIPHKTYISSTNIVDLQSYYSYISGTSRASDSSEVYISTNTVYIFKLKGRLTKPTIVWHQVKVIGGDGSKFFIITYADPDAVLLGFGPVQVTRI